MPNFLEALNTKMEDIHRPPMIPVGHYRALVAKIPEVKDEHEDYQYVDFNLKIVAPEDDVDPEELQAFGGLSNVIRQHRFIFNKNDQAAFDRSLYQLKRFLIDHLKVDGDDTTPLKQMLDSAPNHSCIVQIGRRADKVDKEIIYENIGKTAPVT